MSFDETDLHTLIMRVHHEHRIPIGKVVRVTLLAVANGDLVLRDLTGAKVPIDPESRIWLQQHSATAEALDDRRPKIWHKPPWSRLKRLLVNEDDFYGWLAVALRVRPRGVPATQPSAITKPSTGENTNNAVQAAAPSVRERGPKRYKLDATIGAMRRQISEGKLTAVDLHDMKEKELESRYGVSRDTARKARRTVLSEFVDRQITTNDK
jgi:hypothetical protein